jgi:hypothetical protein
MAEAKTRKKSDAIKATLNSLEKQLGLSDIIGFVGLRRSTENIERRVATREILQSQADLVPST